MNKLPQHFEPGDLVFVTGQGKVAFVVVECQRDEFILRCANKCDNESKTFNVMSMTHVDCVKRRRHWRTEGL